MSMLHVLAALMPKAPPLPSLSAQATTVQGAGTTYTFAGQALGAAGARHIIVAVHSMQSTPRTITSVTVAGITAALVPGTAATYTSNFAHRSALYIAAVPTGTTGDVVVTMSGATDNCGISVWAAYDLLSATAVDGKNVTGFASPANIPSVATAADGIYVASGQYYQVSTSGGFSWANATERADVPTSVAGGYLMCSAADALASGAGIAASAALSGTVDASILMGASFR